MLRRIRTFVVGAAAGAGLAYFLDPRQGRTRRARTKDQLAGKLRRGARKAERGARWAGAEAYGLRQKAAHPSLETPEVDDRTLKDRVESELFGPEFPKGSVLFDVVDGVVTVRGQVRTTNDVKDIERKVARIPGVERVENLLHLPGQTAPNKVEAERASTGVQRGAFSRPTG